MAASNALFPTHLAPQGFAVDEDEDFLFASGQDSRIRGWSLRTGLPISRPTSSATDVKTNPFLTTFPSPVTSLELTQDRSLWAACDRDIYQFHLGQQI